MLFNSLHFLVFLPVVFLLYWQLASKKLQYQHLLLLAAGYYFYGCWDPRFLLLLFFSTALDYFSGKQIAAAATKTSKRTWLWISIGINVGFLGFFKYYNFFIESFATLLGSWSLHTDPWLLNIILPVGISFYTFHGLSYVLDIYHERIQPTTNFLQYAVFISFFPLLVAGPIERANHLLPQLSTTQQFNTAKMKDGLRQILWGFFKKIVIADSCAAYVNMAFNDPAAFNGSSLALAVFFFAMQIYGDFSGYSDIAIGTARLFGFDVKKNFAYPYFSRDIAEFWRRWHISLSTWFRDYVYIPLGGSRGSRWLSIRNIFIIFLLSGFWHGANVTFIIWGGLHAVYFLPLFLFNTNRQHMHIVAEGKAWPGIKDAAKILITFLLVCFAWIFFRANNLQVAGVFIQQMFSASLFEMPDRSMLPLSVFVMIGLFLLIEWKGRQHLYAIEKMCLQYSIYIRWAWYYAILAAIIYFSGQGQSFIYFQF